MSEQQVLPEFIATLKAAAEKATPGPWLRFGKHGTPFIAVKVTEIAVGKQRKPPKPEAVSD